MAGEETSDQGGNHRNVTTISDKGAVVLTEMSDEVYEEMAIIGGLCALLIESGAEDSAAISDEQLRRIESLLDEFVAANTTDGIAKIEQILTRRVDALVTKMTEGSDDIAESN